MTGVTGRVWPLQAVTTRLGDRPRTANHHPRYAERDVWPTKVQQRASGGCWRILQGLADFAVVQCTQPTTRLARVTYPATEDVQTEMEKYARTAQMEILTAVGTDAGTGVSQRACRLSATA
jgi:hypothetical protein